MPFVAAVATVATSLNAFLTLPRRDPPCGVFQSGSNSVGLNSVAPPLFIPVCVIPCRAKATGSVVPPPLLGWSPIPFPAVDRGVSASPALPSTARFISTRRITSPASSLMCRKTIRLSSRPSLVSITSNLPTDEAKDVDESSKDAGSRYESLDQSTKAEGIVIDDGIYAQELLQEAFPVRAGRNVKAAIGEAFEALQRRERSLPRAIMQGRERSWTERRVKAIWGREARRIDHYEIQDLTAVAVEEARRELQRSKARQERLAALLADPASYRGSQLAHLVRERVGGMDRPGNSGTDADDFNQEHWGR